jgi:hypothetical protein
VSKVIIWGLLNKRHSHRYIHQGYFESFKKMGHDVIWVDDSKKNQKLLKGKNLIFAANMASEFLINNPANLYVTHNIEDRKFKEAENVLRLQVKTVDSTGDPLDDSVALYDSNSKTLFQPWGIPEPEDTWLNANQNPGKTEYWIGSIWNNSLNQGNTEAVSDFRLACEDIGFKLKRIGGTRWITKNGISSAKAFSYVNQSPIGAAIVGQWQKEKGYLPCRIFKNVAAGMIPSSNSDMSSIFGDIGVFNPNIAELVTYVSTLSPQEKYNRAKSAQEKIVLYKYESAIDRILQAIDHGY